MCALRVVPFLVLSLCGAASPPEAFAQGGWYLPDSMTERKLGITDKLAKCMETIEGGATAGRRECLGEENKRQDDRMNAAYKSAMKRLHPTRQSLLRESQRAWLKFVPSQCELEAGPPTGGTDWNDELAVCDLHWRAYRAQFLESLEE